MTLETAEANILQLSSAGLALLGGFSASLLYRVLTRMSDALEALLTGEMNARESRAHAAGEQAPGPLAPPAVDDEQVAGHLRPRTDAASRAAHDGERTTLDAVTDEMPADGSEHQATANVAAAPGKISPDAAPAPDAAQRRA